MARFSYSLTLRLMKATSVLLMVIPLTVCWCCCYAADAGFAGWQAAAAVAILFALLYVTYGRIYDAFRVSTASVPELIYSQCLSLLISDALMYLVFAFVSRCLIALVPMLLVMAAQLICSVCWSYLVSAWYYRKNPPKKTAVIYGRKKGIENLISSYGMDKQFRVSQVVSATACIESKMQCLEQTEVVFLCGIQSHERNVILKYCIQNNILVYVLPRIGDTIMSGAKPVHLFHLPFLRVGRFEPTPEYLIAKRVFDVVVSGIALVVLSPLLLLTAAAIKLTDGGPVFYRQTRLTKDGREFNVLKFRSMRQDAEKDGVARLSSGDHDDRITPVGRIIRSLRVDELPQLINILSGTMSLVGPRPERPEIASEYEKELPEFALRLQAKAGLTGYAQVYGKYNTTPYDKLQMDLMYIANASFWEDLRIIFATVKILFMPESTEGLAEDAYTAMERQEEDKVEV